MGTEHATGAEGASLEPMLYRELRRIAAGRLARERPDHTLSPTALVHEAWFALSAQRAPFQSRAHFLAVASVAMRRILLHAAEARRAAKRGGGQAAEPLDPELPALEFDPDAVISLDQHLTRLAAEHPRAARVLELKVFAGMTFDEIAEVTEVSVPTARRDWRLARALLAEHLEGEP